MRAAPATRAACLVVDVELGATSGPQLLLDLPARGLQFPAILMSGSDDPALADLAREIGCLAFLPKPFAPNDLLEVLAHTLVFGGTLRLACFASAGRARVAPGGGRHATARRKARLNAASRTRSRPARRPRRSPSVLSRSRWRARCMRQPAR